MKKVSILIIAIIALVTSYAQAQNKQSSNWNISLGVGVSSSEAMNLGFAQGAQIGYSVGVFEFGASFSHAFAHPPLLQRDTDLGIGMKDEKRVYRFLKVQRIKRESSLLPIHLLSIFMWVSIL